MIETNAVTVPVSPDVAKFFKEQANKELGMKAGSDLGLRPDLKPTQLLLQQVDIDFSLRYFRRCGVYPDRYYLLLKMLCGLLWQHCEADPENEGASRLTCPRMEAGRWGYILRHLIGYVCSADEYRTPERSEEQEALRVDLKSLQHQLYSAVG